MNYPLWDLPGTGLLIAFVAIVHVFVSHFAVGGGLFLVLAERKARRENDDELLGYLKRHSRFFILLTLVFGAVTGVGIWFTIGLVHPAATSSLINTFVWGWAIEWTFFLTEIAAAIVYYYGWERLTAKQHMAVGWVYFVSAFASLVVINGILTYMLTPGRWIENHNFWSGFFNPTYFPALAIRTLGAAGLAGVYAIFTASWMKGVSDTLQRKLTRYAAMNWVLPMAIGLPIALIWYFAAASAAGVPVAEVFGTVSAGATDLLRSVFTTSQNGQPVAQLALRVGFVAITATVVLSFSLLLFRRVRLSRIATAAIMLAALVSIGASEWTREGLRKPYVIGSYMYVTGEREPVDTAKSVLERARWVRSPDHGAEIFRLQCSQCHTLDGYLAIRPLVRGRSSASMDAMMGRLHQWRGRRMPPFTGTDDDRYAVSVYLAKLGGGTVSPPATQPSGAASFDSHCAMCHGEGSEFPIAPLVAGKSEAQLYDAIGRLPDLNPMMPPFDGSEAERRALARHLAAMR